MAQIATKSGLDSLLKNDFSYASKYEIELTFPSGISATKDMLLRCDSVSIPGRNLRTVGDFNIYGPPVEVVQGLTFGEISTTFYLSPDLRERRIMELWQDTIIDPTTFDLGYYDDYVGSLKVFTLDKRDVRTSGYELREAYPKSIDVISLGHSSSNTLNKLSVSFQYRYWSRIQLITEPSF